MFVFTLSVLFIMSLESVQVLGLWYLHDVTSSQDYSPFEASRVRLVLDADGRLDIVVSTNL